MDFKNYYAILGVSQDADDKTIKKAYQQLAKKYHPDVNPGNKEAEEKFKEITEAYQAISDPEKRRKYEEVRQNYEAWQKHGGQGDFDWSRWQAQPGEGTYTQTMSPEEFAKMFGHSGWGNFSSGGGFSDFFSTIFGMDEMNQHIPFSQRRTQRTAPTSSGGDFELDVNITLEESYHGTARIIDTGGKRIQAKIPRGVRTGSKVRLAGQGISGYGGGPKGDLYLNLTVEPHALYSRTENNLEILLPIDFYTAVLGGTTKVRTFSGEIALKIPPLTQSGTKLRLKGKGMPHLENPRLFGDLLILIEINLPSNLSEDEIKTLRDLAGKHQRIQS